MPPMESETSFRWEHLEVRNTIDMQMCVLFLAIYMSRCPFVKESIRPTFLPSFNTVLDLSERIKTPMMVNRDQSFLRAPCTIFSLSDATSNNHFVLDSSLI